MQIVNGVREAQCAVDDGAEVNPRLSSNSGEKLTGSSSGLVVKPVDFDVVVAVSDSSGSNKGAKLTVMGLHIGGESTKGIEASQVSRIQFQVPLAMPVHDPNVKKPGWQGTPPKVR